MVSKITGCCDQDHFGHRLSANHSTGTREETLFDKILDSYISSYDVSEGRPYPYMIHQLIERVGVADVRRVCKIGDPCRDIEMGKNAGCGLVIGVLSGADGAEALYAAGADVVCDLITDLPVPTEPRLVGA